MEELFHFFSAQENCLSLSDALERFVVYCHLDLVEYAILGISVLGLIGEGTQLQAL